jgi:hypothetical protein
VLNLDLLLVFLVLLVLLVLLVFRHVPTALRTRTAAYGWRSRAPGRRWPAPWWLRAGFAGEKGPPFRSRAKRTAGGTTSPSSESTTTSGGAARRASNAPLPPLPPARTRVAGVTAAPARPAGVTASSHAPSSSLSSITCSRGAPASARPP